MTARTVTVRARFETGHRLPQLYGKCHNLHGHSWQAWITVTGELNTETVLVDFGDLKSGVQDWVDEHLDHGMMLGAGDEWGARLAAGGLKVFRFGDEPHSWDLPWPSVEAVAELLARVTEDLIDTLDMPVQLQRVVVQETENNRAEVIR